MSQIDEQIWIGNASDSASKQFQDERGITHILCCAEEFKFPPGFIYVTQTTERWYRIPIVDNVADSTTEGYFREGASKLNEWIKAGHKVMVHCYAGMSRSVSVVIAYYMLYKGWTYEAKPHMTALQPLVGWTYDTAYLHCKQRRKQTNPHPEFVKILKSLRNLGMNSERIPGISFVLRVRNEETYLTDCLASLKSITVPHEIIVILHKCTDTSKAIVKAASIEGQPIRSIETDQDLSKAGYETLVTPTNHPASLMSFYNWCFSHAKYNWLFKWDADFTTSPELVDFLNTVLVLDEVTPVHYTVPCQMTPEIVNREKYLFNCLITYTKWIFWEVPSFPLTVEGRSIDAQIYTIPPSILKPYWKEPPWFIGKDAFLEEQYRKITVFCGPEPIGASRAQCKDCDVSYFMVISCRVFLATLGIYTNR